MFGAWYFWAQRRARDSDSLEQVHVVAAHRFNVSIIRRGFDGADCVYGCNGASLELFSRAHDRGIRRVLEQTIAPRDIENALMREEVQRWNGWEPRLRVGVHGPLAERERREWQLADVILAGSSFVVDGLRACGVAEEKCRVVPYGVPLDRFFPTRRRESAKLRLLFAGEVGLRKGVPYLLEALRLIDSALIETVVAGRLVLDRSRLRPYEHLAAFPGAVPRREMPSLFQWADILVLPSICEGSAVVAYEALASGVPVIATPNAGVPVRDGIDGLIVPIRDAEALAAALERFVRDRDFLRSCSEKALGGRDRLGLNVYGRRLASAIRVLMSAEPS